MQGFVDIGLQAVLNKFYTGLKIYVDYQNGLPTNDGLTPATPVDTVATAMNVALNYYNIPKIVYIIRGTPTKKGDVIDEPVEINVPWTMVDFGFIPFNLTIDGLTAVTIAHNYCGVINANIDLSQQPNAGYGIRMNGDFFNFVILSNIIGAKTLGITGGGSGAVNIIANCGISFNEIGLDIMERQFIFVFNNIFLGNNIAINAVGGDGQAFVTRNLFMQNIIDVKDEEYYYTNNDGIGGLNKLTSPSSVFTPGEYTGFLLIDSMNNVYKITGNTEKELNVVGVNFDGSPKDVTPADGEFYILHREHDVFFYENFWDKLENASAHPYGDSNSDGVLDKLIQMPERGIGIGRSSQIDPRPLTRVSVLGGIGNLDLNNMVLNQLFLMNNREFVKAITDIPSRNVRAGMLEKIRRRIENIEQIEEYTYDSVRDVIKTEVKS